MPRGVLIIAGFAIVTFIVTLAVSVETIHGPRPGIEPARAVSGADPARGRELIEANGCGTCHTIPGVRRADGRVGPPLGGIAERRYLAGQLINTPDNLARWVRDPQGVEPGTAMPDVGLSPEESRHVAAYLYTLE